MWQAHSSSQPTNLIVFKLLEYLPVLPLVPIIHILRLLICYIKCIVNVIILKNFCTSYLGLQKKRKLCALEYIVFGVHGLL